MTYDVAIIGAGPSGMAAAVTLSALSLSVIVIDEQPAPGGQIWRSIERNQTSSVWSALGADYSKGSQLVESFRNARIDYLPMTQLWQIEDGWTLFLTADHKAWSINAKVLLLANGAQERPVPFPGWTLPGVMGVGAAQILLKSGNMLPKGKLWIAGAGPLPLLYAKQLMDLNVAVEGFLDTSGRPALSALSHLPRALKDVKSLAKGLRWRREVAGKTRLVGRVENFHASGERRLEFVNWTTCSGAQQAEADILLVHEGVVPRIHETLALGCIHDWDNQQMCMTPRLDEWRQTSRANLYVAGDAGGIGGWLAATITGEIAALGAARRLGVTGDAQAMGRRKRLDERLRKALAIRPFLDALFLPPAHRIPDNVIVCRCEEVTAGTVRAAARNSAPDPNAVKAATRCGMGPCQGRQCGYSVQRIIADVHEVPVEEVGFYNIRPPLKPVTLGEIASLETMEKAG
ncbi:NAD(P)/FAD-dependent oxidoreductase [Notoacmeibacter ruber]|uniref:FAD-binding protein n=1 Tax=Notoacmeibacter ruber TaxID=2670375 RepID=A0A3L7J3P5_9HYPH|nr:NAD(P)/FAD-dependent oxidoreductase [Notoacmeibacter ruber]RLQ85203.1 FAD-binding protein [Notoacmeibacter ruber]